MIAKAFFGLEGVLADELQALGASEVRPGRRMCAFRGDRALLYRANVRCRTAVRVLKPIHTFVASDEQALYRGVGQIDWSEHLDAEGTLAIDPVVHGGVFSNSLYAAQVAKDAIVDQMRATAGRRPSVDLVDPDLRINLHVDRDAVTVYLDASGDSLHKRGYRSSAGEAPINEVLAAGILRLTGWDAASGLSDFMCGSGTFLIEGALMARRIAPGAIRRQFGYMRWKDFCRPTHEAELDIARREVLPSLAFEIQGSDLDAAAIQAARANARRAGVDSDIRWSVENFETAVPLAASGTLVTNPPYDARMKLAHVEAVYRRIGDALKRHWAGHTAFVVSGNLEAIKHFGLRASAKIRLFNGPIECRLVRFDMFAAPDAEVSAKKHMPDQDGEDLVRAFANRLRRMARHWHRRFRRQGVSGYRIYDRDVPDVPLAIDWYDGHLLVSEYDRPHGRTQIEHAAWLGRMIDVAADVVDVPRDRVVTRRRAAKGGPRPATNDESRIVHIHERSLAFEVDLSAPRDSGLPLDRRILRSMIQATSAGKRVLMLFARTGTAAVAAAKGGASSTLSVEAASRLVAWTEQNLRLNQLSGDSNRVLCQDPIEFVRQLDPSAGGQFDLAIVEPPGFDGKRREGVWNVQDGHVDLINRLLACMEVGGEVIFVTTFRRLKLHTERLRRASVREITRQTAAPDFRDKKAHRAWSIVHTAS